MKITFYNEHGRIDMSGGGRKCDIKIKEISGLGMVEKSYKYTTYPGIAGQEVSDVTILPRQITIKVDIEEKFLSDSISRISCVLEKDGVLIVENGRKRREIGARCVAFVKDERKAKLTEAVFQFVADNPYFTDCVRKEVLVRERKGSLISPFSLPCVFSERKTSANISVLGGVMSEPEIFITGKISNIYETENDEIVIKNKTTGASITLNYRIAPGETIKIDIPKRSVTKENGEKLISCLSDDTYLSEFYLAPGFNVIETESLQRLSLRLVYKNNYTEAMR